MDGVPYKEHEPGAVTCVGRAAVLGVAVYAAQLLASAWWLRRFRFGPVEWAWRCVTYAAWQPIRR